MSKTLLSGGLIAGALAGVVVALLQLWLIQPLIIEAERYCRVAVKYETRRVGRHFLPLIVRFCCQWGGPLSGAFHDPINGD